MFLGFLVSVSNGLSFSNQVGVKVRMGKLLRSDGLVGGRFRTELLRTTTRGWSCCLWGCMVIGTVSGESSDRWDGGTWQAKKKDSSDDEKAATAVFEHIPFAQKFFA